MASASRLDGRPSLEPPAGSRAASAGGPRGGTVALTFDDGPDPVWTARLLDLLRQARARATFFVIAPRAIEHHGLITSIRADGHEVGFHCTEHVRHSELSEEQLGRDLAGGLDRLASLGVEPISWRTPWGVQSEATRRLAAANELRLCGWTLDSHDWRGDSAEEMRAAFDARGGLRDGDVVLMHDGLGPGALRRGCGETLRLTGDLLHAALDAGLRPVPVSEGAGAPA